MGTMLTRENYDKLLSGELGYLVNEYPETWRQLRAGSLVNIFPGSFNPLHDGHLAIWNSVEGPKFFEISITRYGKDPYPFAHFNELLSQFHNKLPYIVSNSYDFLSKSLLLRHWNVNWLLGFDTSARIYSMYTKAILESMGTFEIFSRKIDGNLYNVNAIESPPSNFKIGTLVTDEFTHVSSTNIRKTSFDS